MTLKEKLVAAAAGAMLTAGPVHAQGMSWTTSPANPYNSSSAQGYYSNGLSPEDTPQKDAAFIVMMPETERDLRRIIADPANGPLEIESFVKDRNMRGFNVSWSGFVYNVSWSRFIYRARENVLGARDRYANDEQVTAIIWRMHALHNDHALVTAFEVTGAVAALIGGAMFLNARRRRRREPAP
ncbi:MAG: hypothetical protein M3O22_03090 [Pseudomonadota bacterium]|nr:hypothetical protein [Pseudomonadota bacterium]